MDKMKSNNSSASGMNLKDNTQASPVKSINTNSEQYDVSRIKKYSAGSKGYPSQALPNSI
jgi:hypothetical protein